MSHVPDDFIFQSGYLTKTNANSDPNLVQELSAGTQFVKQPLRAGAWHVTIHTQVMTETTDGSGGIYLSPEYLFVAQVLLDGAVKGTIFSPVNVAGPNKNVFKFAFTKSTNFVLQVRPGFVRIPSEDGGMQLCYDVLLEWYAPHSEAT